MAKLHKLKFHVLVCAHKHCLKRGGREAAKSIKRAVKDHELQGRVLLTAVDCLDQCDEGPCMVVYPEGVWYGRVDETAAEQIVEQHLVGGRPVGENILGEVGGARDAGDEG